MAIYIPQQFAATDERRARRLIADHPFATLLTGADGTEPQITYLPLLLDGDALLGHVARANPHWQRFAGGRTLALFHGPHAYVSPRWYAHPAANVPTWNYAVVHVHGAPQLLDRDGARAALQRLADRFEPAASAPAHVERLLHGIVAFRMPMARIEAKFKMSQNKTAADRAGIAAGLLATGRAGESAVADWMQPDAGS